MPTDLGQARPQVRAARGELQCGWSAAPTGITGLRQQQATVERSYIGRAKSAGPAGLTEWLPIVRTPLLAHSPGVIRLTAMPTCARTCSRGNATREQQAWKEALFVRCFLSGER